MIEKDDYDEFNVSFKKFDESMDEFKSEIKKMVLNGHSDQEIKEVIDNGIKALITMAFNLDKNITQFGFHLVERTLKQANDIAFGHLRNELLRKNNINL